MWKGCARFVTDLIMKLLKIKRPIKSKIFSFFPCLHHPNNPFDNICFIFPCSNQLPNRVFLGKKNMNWGHFPPPFRPHPLSYALCTTCFNTEENCGFPTKCICVLPCFSTNAAIIFLYIALPGFVAGCLRNLNRIS